MFCSFKTKLGSRLTHRPCKGEEFEIKIFGAKVEQLVFVGLVQKCSQHGYVFFDWQARDSGSKICVSSAR